MSFNKIPVWSSQNSRKKSVDELDENHVHKKRLSRQIIYKNSLTPKKNLFNHEFQDALIDPDQVNSGDVSLLRNKLNSKPSDLDKTIFNKNIIPEFSSPTNHIDKSFDSSIHPIKNEEEDIGLLKNSDKSLPNCDLFSSINKSQDILNSDLNHEFESVNALEVSDADLISKIINAGSLVGAGNTISAITQIKQELNDILTAFDSKRTTFDDLKQSEKDEILFNINFLEGYCEMASIKAEERLRLDEQFRILKENLNFTTPAFIVQSVASELQSDSLLSVSNVQSKVVRSILSQSHSDDFTDNYELIEKNRRL